MKLNPWIALVVVLGIAAAGTFLAAIWLGPMTVPDKLAATGGIFVFGSFFSALGAI